MMVLANLQFITAVTSKWRYHHSQRLLMAGVWRNQILVPTGPYCLPLLVAAQDVLFLKSRTSDVCTGHF